jgi:PKD repeat protein
MRRNLLVSVVACLLGWKGAACAGEHTVVLQQGQPVYGEVYAGTSDNTMYSYSGAANTNYGRYSQLESNDTHRFLMKFKVFKSEGGPVPDGATISGATLQIYKTSAYNYGPYSLYRVLKSWNELESCWNNSKAGDPWASSGCSGAGTDRTADPVATPSCGWDPGWMTVDVTSSLQAWAGGAANEGWLLVDPYGNLRAWAARDYTADVTKRPKLTITYAGNTAPVATAYGLPSKGIAPLTTTFDASASSDSDGTIVSYLWAFGDGSDPATGMRVDHVYTTAGSYTATLTITDDAGGAAVRQFPITVYTANAAFSLCLQDGLNGYSGTRDSETYKYHADGVHGFETTIRSGEGDNYRPMFRFATFTDEGGSIPRGAEILSATMCLYKTSAYNASWQIYQLKKVFVEGETSWNRASTAEAWAVPGACGDGTDRVAAMVSQPWMGWDPGWLMVDVTASLQNLSNGAANCGWVLVDQVSGNIRAFAARENADQTIHPKLLITYRVPPTAVIATNPNPPKGVAPYKVSFNASGSQDSDGTILNYYWTFGDGGVGEGVTVDHVYTVPGCYKATLVLTDDQGTVATASVYVGVAAEGAGTEQMVLQDGLNNYAGTEDTYLDGYAPTTARGTSEALNLTGNNHPLVKFKVFTTEGGPVPAGRKVKDAKLALYKYSAYDSVVGAKRVLKNWNEAEATWNKANATTDWGAAGAGQVGVDVATGEEPLVTMPWDPAWIEFPVTGDVENFRTAALANNGWQIWYYWGNSNPRNFRSSEYAADTTKRPKLTVQYSGNSAPVAFAESDIQGGSPPLGVQFTGTGIDADGAIASYSWDFGDGSSATEQNPVHQYLTSGRFTATLTVTDDGGLSAQATVYIEVDSPYTLTFQKGDGGSYSETEDCNLKSDYPSGQNEAGSLYLEAFKSATTTRRALIRFPNVVGHAEGQIPHDAKIVSAKLRLSPTNAVQGQKIAVHRITEGWSIPYGAPWWNTRRAGGATWGAPGCGYIDEEHKSRVQNPEDTQTLDGRPFPYEWDVTEAVKAWANDTDLNQGFVVEMPENGNLMGFRSSDHNEQALRPMLLVTISDLPDITAPKLAITSELTSQTKRAFVEGTKDAEVDTISLTAGGNAVDVTVTNATHWFAFVERNGTNSVELVATATDAAGNQTQVNKTILFTPVDAASNGGLLMQAGDSALITVTPSDPDAASIEIDPGDGGAVVAGDLGATLEVPYLAAGEYTATARVLDSESNVLASYTVSVTAISIIMKPGFALGAKQGYAGSGPEPYYEVAVTPVSAANQIYLLAENDNLLTVKDREVTETSVKAKVVQERPSIAFIQARLGNTIGRVLGREGLIGFTLDVSDWFGNQDTDVGFAILRMQPVVPGLRLNVTLGGGATFLDGTSQVDCSSNDLDASGELEFRCRVPDSAPDFETTARAYQSQSEEQFKAVLYDNGGWAKLWLRPLIVHETEIPAEGLMYIDGKKRRRQNKEDFSVTCHWAPKAEKVYEPTEPDKASEIVFPKGGEGEEEILKETERPKYPLVHANERKPSKAGTYDVVVRLGNKYGGREVRFYSVLTIVKEVNALVVVTEEHGNQQIDKTDPEGADAESIRKDRADEIVYEGQGAEGIVPISFDVAKVVGNKTDYRWQIEDENGNPITDVGSLEASKPQRWPWRPNIIGGDGKPIRRVVVHSWKPKADRPDEKEYERRVQVVIVNADVLVHATDADTHETASMRFRGKKHFCTVKGTGNVVLVASMEPDLSDKVSWRTSAEGVALASPAVGTDKKTVSFSRSMDNGKQIPLQMMIADSVVWDGFGWVIWATCSKVDQVPIELDHYVVVQLKKVNGLVISGGYKFEFAVQPTSVVDKHADIPNLAGIKTVDVPGGDRVHILSGELLRNGAQRKWDVSRQARVKVLNPQLYDKDQLLASANPKATLWKNQPKAIDVPETYPGDEEGPLGNDDTGVEAPHDPYASGGKLNSSDKPTSFMVDSVGQNGDSFELRFQYREFVRIELGRKWYRCSDFKLWRAHHRFSKKANAWIGTGVNGICDSDVDEKNDQVAWSPTKGRGEPFQMAIVDPSVKPTGDDKEGTALGIRIINTGPNGICETQDPNPQKHVIQKDKGKPDTRAVFAGLDGKLDSVRQLDDTVNPGWTNDASLLAEDNEGWE